MRASLATVILALATFTIPVVAMAQNQAQDQDTDNSSHIVTGCLQKAGKGFSLLDEGGKLWEVHSKRVRLGPHVGQKVTLTGVIPQQPKTSTDTAPQNHLAVTSVRMVEGACNQ
jgi:hypothetical protein